MNNIKQILKKVINTNFQAFFLKSFYSLHPKHKFDKNWHIEYILRGLQSLEDGKSKRLIINMPPRYLKSFCVSVVWPAWLLAQNPNTKIIVASHSLRLAKKLSADCRDIINSKWYQEAFQTRPSDQQNTKEKFMTSAHGFRIACSVGSNITGEGADYLVVDDPITPQQVFSKKYRQKVNEWFSHTFASRLNDKKRGAILVVMQRLHNYDLTDYLLKRGDWQVMRIAAIATYA
jgi:hypothetical protein